MYRDSRYIYKALDTPLSWSVYKATNQISFKALRYQPIQNKAPVSEELGLDDEQDPTSDIHR